jgi:predicted RNase H-like nuclease (RuvC/YqgF family)
MPLPRELNPSRRESFVSPLEHQRRDTQHEENAGLSLEARVTKLETRNLYLQSLVVELLDKNEQLRRKVTPQHKQADEFLSQ